MSIIRNDDILFYHPLDSDTEYTQSYDWTRNGSGVFDTGVIVSGFTQSGDTTVDIRAVKADGGYDDLENYENFTVAFWSSGLYGGTIKDDTIEIGFGNTNVDDGNGIRYFMSETAGTPYVRLIKRGGTAGAKQIPVFPSVEGWHLTIIDMTKNGSLWDHSVSINGSGWQMVGSGGNADLPDTDVNCIIDLALESTSENVILDEVAIWAGHDQFTSTELSNIYELVNTYGLSMDQYGSIFGAPSSSGADLFIHGHTDTSGDVGLYIPGQVEVNSVDLYINAPGPSSGDIDTFIHGYDQSSGNIDHYTQGHIQVSGDVDFYISGIPAISSSVTLYTSGPLFANSSGDHYTWGHMTASGDCPFFIAGRSQDIDAFAAVADNNPSDTLDLFTHGVPSGASTVFYTNDSVTLFIQDSNDDTIIDTAWPAFVKTAVAITDSHSDTWSSFVRGGNTVNDSVDLYINSHASGEAPRGILVTGSMTTYISGRSAQVGDEGLLSDGYEAANVETIAFTKVHFGVNDMVSFYVSGTIPVVSPSSVLNLFIFGVSGTTSDSHTLYMPSKQLIVDNCNLFVFGVKGIASENCPLYIEVTDIGLFNRSATVYLHGF